MLEFALAEPSTWSPEDTGVVPAVEPVREPFDEAPAPQQPTLSRTERLLEVLCSVVGADWGGLGRLSPHGEVLEHATYHGDGLRSAGPVEPVESAAFLHAMLRRGSGRLLVSVTDVAALEQLPGQPAIGSILALTFAATGRSRGVAYLVRSVSRPSFGPDEERALSSFRTWLEQECLVEENQLLVRLRVLNQVAQIASSELALPEMIGRSLRELERFFPLHLHSVWLLDTDGQKEPDDDLAGATASLSSGSVKARRPASRSHLVLADNKSSCSRRRTLGLAAGWRLAIEDTPFGPCLQGAPAFYADLRLAEKRSNALCQQLAERGALSFFAVPLRAGTRTVGMLQIASTSPAGISNEHVQTIYLVADLLGPAISNCQLVSRLRTAYQHLHATKDKLVQTEKVRALGELAAGVAHNFNNALCSVLGFIELAMIDPALPSSCRSLLETSRLSALDAAQIVRRVQAFARAEQEKTEFQVIDVNQLVDDAVELTRPRWETEQLRAEKPAIEIDVETAAAAAIDGTPTELREVLTNLIFNAVDAMPDGGRLSLRTWSTADGVFVSVADTGVGMSEFVRQRIFEPLFTTKGERGTGLGLSISFAIIQRHHGDMTVKSAPGKGTTFTLKLPPAAPSGTTSVGPAAGLPDASAILSPVPRFVQGTATPATPAVAEGLRVLVVEDEANIRALLEVALTDLGHRPSMAAEGTEALRVFAAEPFDLVLTDVGLPGISGVEVARAISQRSPRVPVVLLTGWADQIPAQMGAVEGVARVLGKPIALATLAATLTELAGKPR